jgi:hypothetical protein
VLAVSLLSLVGCSLVNPHVRWPRPPGTTLADAMKYAQAAMDRYSDAIGDQAVLNNGLALGLIPLGASALGLGMTGGNPAAITALGLTGASAYASGSWVGSRTKSMIYVQGKMAVTCAVDAVRPLEIDEPYLARILGELNQAIASVEDAGRRVRQEADAEVGRSRDKFRAQIAEAREEVRDADRPLAEARQTYGAGVALSQEVRQAGQALISAVDRIAAQVDQALVNNQPDLAALPGVIASLGQLSTQFGPAPKPKAAADKIGQQGEGPDKLNDAVVTLRRNLKDLSAKAALVAALVESVARNSPSKTLQGCGLKDVAGGFTVEPAALEFKEGSEGTKSLFITGGRTPYTAEPLEQPMEGLSLPHAVWWGPRIDVVAKKPKGGPYTLRITDATGQSKSATLTVVKADGGTPGGDAEKPKPATLTADEKQTIQRALCVTLPAKWEEAATQDALRVYQETVTEKPAAGDVTVTDDMKANLLTLKPCPADARNFYETKLGQTRIGGIQDKLKVTGKLDAATRQAIIAFKTKAGIAPPDDQLRREADVKAIEGAS